MFGMEMTVGVVNALNYLAHDATGDDQVYINK